MAHVLDPPRLLAQRSEIGYTDRVDRALPDEPEAVSAAEQRWLTEDAARARETSVRAAWIVARDGAREHLSTLTGEQFKSIERDLRVILRHIEKIDHRLAA